MIKPAHTVRHHLLYRSVPIPYHPLKHFTYHNTQEVCVYSTLWMWQNMDKHRIYTFHPLSKNMMSIIPIFHVTSIALNTANPEISYNHSHHTNTCHFIGIMDAIKSTFCGIALWSIFCVRRRTMRKPEACVVSKLVEACRVSLHAGALHAFSLPLKHHPTTLMSLMGGWMDGCLKGLI